MSRQLLPNRRRSELFDFEHDGITFTGTVSRYADGRIAEVFLNTRKPGSGVGTAARDIGVAASLALQHGTPVETLRRALTCLSDGSAAGPLGHLLDIVEEGR